MDKFLRFSDYDIFAYLAAGLAALAVVDRAFGTAFVLDAHWTPASGSLTVAGAYILGHLVAGPAGMLMDRWLVEKRLGVPSKHLFGAQAHRPRNALLRRLLGDYFRKLDGGIDTRVLARAAAEGKPGTPGEDLFWVAFAVAKRDEAAYARMESFLKLYGFCRNIAFVALAGAPVLLAAAGWRWWQQGWSDVVWHDGLIALVVLLAGGGMLLRYLKFLRLYAVEVFVAYSEKTAEEQ